MKEVKGEKLYVDLGASQVRRRLKGYGFGVRKVHSDGKNRAVIIHTATGDHLRELESLFQDVLRKPSDRTTPLPDTGFPEPEGDHSNEKELP